MHISLGSPDPNHPLPDHILIL